MSESSLEPSHDSTRRDRGIVRRLPGLCLATLAWYAIVALVVLPEGSPSVAERLLALAAIGVVSLVVAAVARWAPGWARGLGMLLVGFSALAVLLGIVAERLLRGPSVGSLFGSIAGVAGIVLIVIGWRRLLAGVRHRWIRATSAIVGTLVVVQMIVFPAVVALLATNRARPVGSGRTPADLGLAFEDVRIPMADGSELAAWWIPARNDAAVIVLPGSGSTRDDVLDHAALLADAGYGALLVDLRGHGDSDGRLMDLGWGAEHDVSDMVTWLESNGVTHVGLFGLSMGGEIALTAAARDPRIGAVVAEGATGRTYEDDALVPASNPIAGAISWEEYAMVRALAPEPEPMPLIEVVRRIDAPVLLIEGAGPSEAQVGPLFAEAAPQTLTLWEIPESPHIGGLSTRPQEYRQRVLALFDETLG